MLQCCARPIWLIGSKTTIAPAAAAISPVRSVELLSQTTTSVVQPAAANADEAALMAASDCGSNVLR